MHYLPYFEFCNKVKKNFIILVSVICLSITGSPLLYALESSVPRRVVSLAPVLTQILIVLDLDEYLVGRTSYCMVGESSIPEVGGYLDTSIEKVYSLKPDLVISLKGETRTPAKLRKFGIQVEEFRNESIRGIEEAIIRIGTLFNQADKAQKLVKQKKAEFQVVLEQAKLLNLTGTSVLVLLDEGSGARFRKSFYGASKGSFYDHMLQSFGLRNVLNVDSIYGMLSVESIKSLSPDIIFIIGGNSESEMSNGSYFLLPDTKVVPIREEVMQYPGVEYPKIGEVFLQALKKTSIGKGKR
jgi:ABC-type Fe3+-hydroxamate transport system substrate-binding protein